jgi:putative ABC transport system ATP-binding protein
MDKSVPVGEDADRRRTFMRGKTPVEALRGVNLRIEPREFLSILGPAGNVKRALLHLIGALDKPTSGKLLADGVEIATLNDNQLDVRMKIGMVCFKFKQVDALRYE